MLHIFDVDNTVINHTSAWYFLLEALGTGVIRYSQIRALPLEWIRYKLGKPNMDFIENAVKHLGGLERSTLERTAEDAFLKRIKPNIFAGSSALIRGALSRGEEVIFATSSLDIIILPLARFLGIECSITSKLDFCDGRTTGSVVEDSCFGYKKMSAVEKWLNANGYSADSACFYSDSYTDLPLLKFCGKAVAVNPDGILLKEAKKHGWEILHFKKTIKNV